VQRAIKEAHLHHAVVTVTRHEVWFDPLDDRRVTNFRVQRYRGRPVLTWWSAIRSKGPGHNGLYVIADDSYRVIKTISPADGLAGDLHEFLLTPRGTAIVTAYHRPRPHAPLACCALVTQLGRAIVSASTTV